MSKRMQAVFIWANVEGKEFGGVFEYGTKSIDNMVASLIARLNKENLHPTDGCINLRIGAVERDENNDMVTNEGAVSI